MKTTLELPDDLLIKAKQVAAERRTTLKEMVTHSLRREIGLDCIGDINVDGPYELSSLGLPRIKKRGESIDSAAVKALAEQVDQEAFDSAVEQRAK